MKWMLENIDTINQDCISCGSIPAHKMGDITSLLYMISAVRDCFIQ